jgi:probable rRNA maturation factor
MNVLVELSGSARVDAEALERAVRRAVKEDGGALSELSLTLLGDDEMRELNKRYLGHDHPTDVIAFKLGEPPDLVGDVYLGLEQARRQADEHGIELRRELQRLAIHGTLHVLGHDHPPGEERWTSPMFALQERILASLTGAGT